jgi:hypothetical protein
MMRPLDFASKRLGIEPSADNNHERENAMISG